MNWKFVRLLLVFFAVTPTLILVGHAQQTQSQQPTQREMRAKWKSWHETMKRTPKPEKSGCFKASYPDTSWHQATCKVAPPVPYPPAKDTHSSAVGTVGGAHAYTVGDGTDDTASVTGTLSSATGSFPLVSGLSSASAYSLQLNSEFFTTSVCDGAAVPSACQGWQQFLYTSSPSETFMQYWLLDWGTTCPSGWYTYSSDCYKNSSATDVAAPELANWAYLELVGGSTSSTDEVTFYPGAGDVSATGEDSVLNLEDVWNQAEFNVFGNGSGSEVTFNSGATFAVETSLVNGTTTKPACESTGFTGETNNLSLVGSCCPYAGSTYVSPNIQFLESSNSAATESCGAGGLVSNVTAVPSSSGTYSSSGGEYPTVTFTETLTDSTPGAEIYWTVSGCSGSTSGSDPVSSGGSFTLVYESEYDCNPSGTMYATESGYIASPVTSIDFP
jgi:hypothetical protein